MQRNTLLAALVAAAFAFPLAASAGGKDKQASANGANGPRNPVWSLPGPPWITKAAGFSRRPAPSAASPVPSMSK